jgi:hypothetical protein
MLGDYTWATYRPPGISYPVEPRRKEMGVTTTYLTTAGAARLLGVTPDSVRLYAKQGQLPVAVVSESGIKLFKRDDVEQLAKCRAARKKIAGWKRDHVPR